jgi:hypothetical protein
VTAAEVFLAAILATGLTNLSVDAVELALLAGAGAGLSVIYNGLRYWLEERSKIVQLVRALKAERDRQLTDEAKSWPPP